MTDDGAEHFRDERRRRRRRREKGRWGVVSEVVGWRGREQGGGAAGRWARENGEREESRFFIYLFKGMLSLASIDYGSRLGIRDDIKSRQNSEEMMSFEKKGDHEREREREQDATASFLFSFSLRFSSSSISAEDRPLIPMLYTLVPELKKEDAKDYRSMDEKREDQ